MSKQYNGKHLTLDERMVIQNCIYGGMSKTEIAIKLNKHKSTIGKEIRFYRTFYTTVNSYPVDCAKFQTCPDKSTCTKLCEKYENFTCKRRDISVGACNGCVKSPHCRFPKATYNAINADRLYKQKLIDTRKGFNLTDEEINFIGNIIAPLLLKGQSPYQIRLNHPELGICEKSLYNYIEAGIFKDFGIDRFVLRRQVSRKKTRKKSEIKLKKRQNRSYLIGRKYDDYLNYINQTGETNIVQMDTVYNDGSTGPFIQTFKFVRFGFMFAILHKEKNALEMNKGIALLSRILGPVLFKKYVAVILPDRGSEFIRAHELEKIRPAEYRTRVFYCDPMQSCQKASLENNHIELRYILPKHKDLYELGLNLQDDLNLVISHINSAPKEKLDGKSPIELLKFLAPNLADRFFKFGIKEINKDEITLLPSLLKK